MEAKTLNSMFNISTLPFHCLIHCKHDCGEHLFTSVFVRLLKRLSSHCSVLLAMFLPCEGLKEAALLLYEGGMFTVQVYASDILFYIILPYFIIFL